MATETYQSPIRQPQTRPAPPTPSQSPKPRPPTCRPLPAELWIRILTYHTDLVHLWQTCRRVSRLHRSCSQQVFLSTVLRNETSIDFVLEKYNLGTHRNPGSIQTTYSHLSPSEPGVVYFREQRGHEDVIREAPGLEVETRDRKRKRKMPTTSSAEQQFRAVMQRWGQNLADSKPELPYYTVRMGDMVNDTALPGLRYDVEQMQVGFEWQPFVYLFMREQARLRDVKREWQASTVGHVVSDQASGEQLPMRGDPWSAAQLEARKQIRRRRLKEQYAGDDEKLWAIDSLQYFQEEKKEHEARRARAQLFPTYIPGAGLGERWFGKTNVVKELFLDEWSSMHRIDMKAEQVAKKKGWRGVAGKHVGEEQWQRQRQRQRLNRAPT